MNLPAMTWNSGTMHYARDMVLLTAHYAWKAGPSYPVLPWQLPAVLYGLTLPVRLSAASPRLSCPQSSTRTRTGQAASPSRDPDMPARAATHWPTCMQGHYLVVTSHCRMSEKHLDRNQMLTSENK